MAFYFALIVTCAWTGAIWFLSRLSCYFIPVLKYRSSYWLTMIILIICFILVLIIFSLLPEKDIPILSSYANSAWSGVNTPFDAEGITYQNNLVSSSINSVLIFLYLAGVGINAARFIYSKNIVSSSLKGAYKSEVAVDGVDIWITPKKVTPFAIGGFQPKIILPEELIIKREMEEWITVARHERAHIRRADTEVSTLISVVAILVWYSPFLHMINRNWRLASELACDQAALCQKEPGICKAYVSMLLDALREPTQQELSFPPASIITNRLRSEKMRINNILTGFSENKKIGVLRVGILTATMAVVCVLNGAAFIAISFPGKVVAQTKDIDHPHISPEEKALISQLKSIKRQLRQIKINRTIDTINEKQAIRILRLMSSSILNDKQKIKITEKEEALASVAMRYADLLTSDEPRTPEFNSLKNELKSRLEKMDKEMASGR